MTREEAIHILDNLKPTNTKSSFDAYVVGNAITMAIKALEQEPCDDAISRELEIKKLKEQPVKVYIDKTDYQRGYIDGVNQMVKEFKVEWQKPIECDDAISRQAVKDLFCRICMESNLCYRSKETCEDLKLFDKLPPVKPQEPSRDMKEIEEVINCDADAETKCKMISNILISKPHYFEKQEPKTGHWIENLCDSCTNKACEFQSGILRSKCDFYIAPMPHLEPDNCGNYIVPQEPKTGHWFIDERPESGRETVCSNCEQPIFKYHKLDFDYRPKYCPNCGAKMVEPQERDYEAEFRNQSEMILNAQKVRIRNDNSRKGQKSIN